MPPTRRIALMFDLGQPDRRVRQLLAGVRRYAEGADHWECIVDPFAVDRRRSLYHGLYHGLIAQAHPAIDNAAHFAGIPLVSVTNHWSHRPMTRLAENRQRAGRLAARHLAAQGYASGLYVGFSRDTDSRLQAEGFLDALWRLGLPGDRLLVHRTAFASKVDGFDAHGNKFLRALDRFTPPVGIYIGRDAEARYLTDILRRLGLRIPDDVGLMGSGNDPDLCEFPPPALTSIDFHFADVGHGAAQLLDRLIDGAPPPPRPVRVQPTLVPRHSTDRARRTDPIIAAALDWIRLHCHAPINPGHVAAAIGTSRRTLQRRFRGARGRTITGEITRARLARATDLLRTTDTPLAHIAHASGFRSARYFSEVFRQHEGITPTAYRRRATEHDE